MTRTVQFGHKLRRSFSLHQVLKLLIPRRETVARRPLGFEQLGERVTLDGTGVSDLQVPLDETTLIAHGDKAVFVRGEPVLAIEGREKAAFETRSTFSVHDGVRVTLPLRFSHVVGGGEILAFGIFKVPFLLGDDGGNGALYRGVPGVIAELDLYNYYERPIGRHVALHTGGPNTLVLPTVEHVVGEKSISVNVTDGNMHIWNVDFVRKGTFFDVTMSIDGIEQLTVSSFDLLGNLGVEEGQQVRFAVGAAGHGAYQTTEIVGATITVPEHSPSTESALNGDTKRLARERMEAVDPEMPVPNAPSVFYGHQGHVYAQYRLPDGGLTEPRDVPWIGVTWQPEVSSTSDPSMLHRGFAIHAASHIPKMAELGVNVVRLYKSLPRTAESLAILDSLWRHGIYVVMAVDSPTHLVNASLQDAIATVEYFKQHAAIMGWVIGNEIDLTKFYGQYRTVFEAFDFAEVVASAIRLRDPSHIIGFSVGDPHIPGVHALSRERYPQHDGAPFMSDLIRRVPSADAVFANLNRGASHYDAPDQFASITDKLVFDAEVTFLQAERGYAVNEDTQARVLRSRLAEVGNAYSRGQMAGAFVHTLTPEHWKTRDITFRVAGNAVAEGNVSLLRDDLSEKPAFAAVQQQVFAEWQSRDLLGALVPRQPHLSTDNVGVIAPATTMPPDTRGEFPREILEVLLPESGDVAANTGTFEAIVMPIAVIRTAIDVTSYTGGATTRVPAFEGRNNATGIKSPLLSIAQVHGVVLQSIAAIPAVSGAEDKTTDIIVEQINEIALAGEVLFTDVLLATTNSMEAPADARIVGQLSRWACSERLQMTCVAHVADIVEAARWTFERTGDMRPPIAAHRAPASSLCIPNITITVATPSLVPDSLAPLKRSTCLGDSEKTSIVRADVSNCSPSVAMLNESDVLGTMTVTVRTSGTFILVTNPGTMPLSHDLESSHYHSVWEFLTDVEVERRLPTEDLTRSLIQMDLLSLRQVSMGKGLPGIGRLQCERILRCIARLAKQTGAGKFYLKVNGGPMFCIAA